MNINRFEQSVCGLQTVVLRGQSKTAHKRFGKGRADVFCRNICGYINIYASYEH